MARFRCPSHLILPALIVVGTGRHGSKARRCRPRSSATSSSTDQGPGSISTMVLGEGTTSAAMRCSIGAATPATVRPERSIRCSTPQTAVCPIPLLLCVLAVDRWPLQQCAAPIQVAPCRTLVASASIRVASPSSPQRRRCPQAGTVSCTWSTSRTTTARPPRTRSSPRSSATS